MEHASLDFVLLLQGCACSDFLLLALSHESLDSTLFLRCFVWTGSSISTLGMSKLGLALLALDASTLGLSLFSRGLARLDPSIPAAGFANPDPSLLLHGAACLDSLVFALHFAKLGSSSSLHCMA